MPSCVCVCECWAFSSFMLCRFCFIYCSAVVIGQRKYSSPHSGKTKWNMITNKVSRCEAEVLFVWVFIVHFPSVEVELTEEFRERKGRTGSHKTEEYQINIQFQFWLMGDKSTCSHRWLYVVISWHIQSQRLCCCYDYCAVLQVSGDVQSFVNV